jgi:hypothetical protein
MSGEVFRTKNDECRIINIPCKEDPEKKQILIECKPNYNRETLFNEKWNIVEYV